MQFCFYFRPLKARYESAVWRFLALEDLQRVFFAKHLTNRSIIVFRGFEAKWIKIETQFQMHQLSFKPI